MNLQDLRKLAEAATPGDWGAYIDSADECFRIETEDYDIGVIYSHKDGGFIAAANPATVIALIDLIAQCKEALEAQENDWQRLEWGYNLEIRHQINKAIAAIEQWEKK